jgi:light-regulated signal transduction histidine kinase (bacteriophytochrome)
MSAAAVVLDSPRFLEAPAPKPSSDEQLRDLIHDLRQPLSSIEAIAYYLEMTLPADQVQAREHMTHLQNLVQQASAMLEQSAAHVRKPCARAHSAGI